MTDYFALIETFQHGLGYLRIIRLEPIKNIYLLARRDLHNGSLVNLLKLSLPDNRLSIDAQHLSIGYIF